MVKLLDNCVDFAKKHIGIILTIFFDLYVFFNLKSQLPSGSNKTLFLCIGICVISNLILLLVLKKIPKFKNQYHKIFLLIAIPIGLLYAILIPVFAGTDEPLHFFRAYQISEGTVFVDEKNYDTKIPSNVLNLHYRTIKENYVPFRLFESLEKNNKVELPIKDAAGQYSPVQYFPQIVGIKIGELFNLSPMLIVILARFLVFATWCIFNYFAIKLFPYNKLLFLFICLSPAMLSLVSTTSGDIMLNAFSFLFISYVLNIFHNKSKINNKQILLLLLLCICISLCKTIYVALTLLILILPYESFGSKRKKWICTSVILFTSIVADVGWVNLSSINLTSSETNSMQQISYVLHNPIDYIFIIFRTFLGNLYYYVINLFSGNEMCYSRVTIPSILSIAYVVLVYNSLKYNMNVDELKKVKYIFYFIFIIIFGATATALYVNWTNTYGGIGYPYIMGVQSRYFISLIPLLLITLNFNFINKIKEEFLINSCVYLNVFILLCTISSLIIVYR